MTKLDDLKATDDAPAWMNENGYKTLLGGYLLPQETPRDMYRRVATAAASYYEESDVWKEKFFDAMWKNWLCPASPILSNFGTDRGLPISCNSIHVGDSVDSIFQKNYELAMLSKNGAGVGIYIGDVRGRGKSISGNGKSEGIIPWAKVYDATTVSVSQGCYDDKTELLTENGWKPFSELAPDERVAQVTSTGELSFTPYTNYVCYHVDEELYRFTNKTNSIDLLVTGNHRMAYERYQRVDNRRDSNGKSLSNKKAHDGYLRIKDAKSFTPHRDNRFWVAATAAIGDGTTLSPLERFHIAYQADGSSTSCGNSTGAISNTLYYVFRFKKQRKIDRLISIVESLGWSFIVKKQKDDTTNINVKVPLNVTLSKKLTDAFSISSFSKEKAEQFIEEVSRWDSHRKEKTSSVIYSCVEQSNSEFVQSVAFVAGFMTSLKKLERKNKKDIYKLFVNKRRTVGGDDVIKSTEHYTGNVYCVEVPTGLLVVRRNLTVAVCGNSSRRGASALYLPIEHLDIEEFINIRRPTGDINRRCMNVNHGVCVTDEWMQTMLAGDQAKRALWIEILKNRVESGEPYLFFTDNVNRRNPACYTDKGLTVKTSNICSEIFLHTDPDHSFVCCLSSLNLVKWEEWKDTDLVAIAVRFLDAVLEEYIVKTKEKKGFEASRASAIKGRAVGIGVLGWHSLLQENMIAFDSFEAMRLNAEIFRTMKEKAEEETKKLAEELGEPEWCVGHNRRNTHLFAIAPTVSNSTISGGHSAGIEPIAANMFSQKSAKGTFIRKNSVLERLLVSKEKDTIDVWRSINDKGGSVQHLDFLTKEEKEVFLTAREINQHAIVKQAAQRQKYIDQGQSVNLFFGSNSDPKYIHDVHIAAWENGLKSLYYCRSEGVIRGDLASRTKEECAACEG